MTMPSGNYQGNVDRFWEHVQKVENDIAWNDDYLAQHHFKEMITFFNNAENQGAPMNISDQMFRAIESIEAQFFDTFGYKPLW